MLAHHDCMTFLEKHFAVSIQQPGEPLYAFSSSDLMSSDGRQRIIGLQSRQLGDPGMVVVGTLFAKRYSVFCMGIVSALSLYDNMVDMHLERVRFKVTERAEMEYQIIWDGNPIKTFDKLIRNQEAVDYLFHFFSLHIGPVFTVISDYTGASLSHMWSLVSNNLQNLFLRMESDEIRFTKDRLQIVASDREMLLDHTKWKASGYSSNPLAIRLKLYEHPEYSGEPFYLRKHCCLAYKVRHEGESHGYCNTCPRDDADERNEKIRTV